MFKLLILFAGFCAAALSAEIYYAPGAAATYYAPAGVYAQPAAAVVPLAYARLHAPAVETYNSVQTPDSFQQQYRSDFKPLSYEYIY